MLKNGPLVQISSNHVYNANIKRTKCKGCLSVQKRTSCFVSANFVTSHWLENFLDKSEPSSCLNFLAQVKPPALNRSLFRQFSIKEQSSLTTPNLSPKPLKLMIESLFFRLCWYLSHVQIYISFFSATIIGRFLSMVSL